MIRGLFRLCRPSALPIMAALVLVYSAIGNVPTVGTRDKSEEVYVIAAKCFPSRTAARGVAAAAVLIGLIFGVRVGLADDAEIIELNPGTATYDHHPSVASADDGSTWIAWHTYHQGTDGIVARHVEADGRLGPLHRLSPSGRTHSPPAIVADSAHRAWVVWSMKRGGRWRVTLRKWDKGQWDEPQILSHEERDAIDPTAALSSDGQLFVAWSARHGDSFRIRGCLVEGSARAPVFDVSGEHVPAARYQAQRPMLVRHGAELWAFWDAYQAANYAVQGRRLLPTQAPIERISPAGDYCLTPTALSHSSGLYVAWLRKIDVIGGPGVISSTLR